MLKQMLVCLMGFLLLAEQCFAMTFSRVENVGNVYYPVLKSENVRLENATYIGSKANGKFQGDFGYSYDRLTKFGDGENAVYIHHKSNYGWDSHPLANWGDRNIDNTIKVDIGLCGVKIFQLINNAEIKLYLLEENENYGNLILIGKQKDGKWVKYFVMNDIRKKYFGDKAWHSYSMVGHVVEKPLSNINNKMLKTYCNNDAIVVEYERNIDGLGPIFGKRNNERGEFRFKWDDKAQWFGVEQVVY